MCTVLELEGTCIHNHSCIHMGCKPWTCQYAGLLEHSYPIFKNNNNKNEPKFEVKTLFII